MARTMETMSAWRPVYVLAGVVTLVVVGFALQRAQVVFMPLAFAFVVALLLRPVQSWLDDRLPEGWGWVSVTLTIGVFVLALAVLGGGLWLAVDRVVEGWPRYQERLGEIWTNVEDWARSSGVPVESMSASDAMNQMGSWLLRGLTSVWEVAVFLVLLFFLTLLMLLEWDDWQSKTISAVRGESGERLRDTARTLGVRVRQYLMMRTVVSAISGAAAAAWLWLVGVDFWYLWGILTFLLNYVPNIGSIIAVIPPTLLAAVQPDGGLLWAIVTVVGLTAIEQVIGNFVDPKLQGRMLSLSPLVVLLSVIFWGWLWGAAGAVLAVPLTVAALIICAHVPVLEPLALLLSRKTDAASLREATHMPRQDGA